MARRNIPQKNDDKTVGLNTIHAFPGGPVGACYPCPAVDACMDCRSHYVGTSKEVYIQTGKAWYCPGGAEAPRNCLSKNFAQSKDGTSCVCNPGLYPLGLECVACLAGYKCPQGYLERCPIHYYQPATGATSCLQCGSTGTAAGFFQGCPRGKLLRVCDPAFPESQNKQLTRNCLPCNQCRRAYTSDEISQDQYDCYRDN